MNDFIYCQQDIPKDKWRYGLRSSAATGCGWIATYNALKIMGYSAKPEKLIKYFERQLPFINGNIGTFMLGPALFFKKYGFGVKTATNRKHFDALASQSSACILFYWWKEKRRIGSHLVALHHIDNGFVGYNTYRQSKGADRYGQSLEQFIEKQKYFGPILIAITDKRKKQEDKL